MISKLAPALVLILSFLSIHVYAAVDKVCLFSGSTVLEPLRLTHADCPNNYTYCMNAIYNYADWRYNGVASLKPASAEILLYLTQDEEGRLDFVTNLNAKTSTVITARIKITGAQPAAGLLYDDPTGDVGLWHPQTNTGNFTWTTSPDYTDGVIVGHINFIDNYCLSASYTPPAGQTNPITTISILTGTVAKPTRVVTQAYTPGTTFQFCQYPVTLVTSTNNVCPGESKGTVQAQITFGPSQATYLWKNAAQEPVGTTANVTDLPSGTYSVHIDANGCIADRTVTISEPISLGFTISRTDIVQTPIVTFGTAQITAVVGGKGPYTYAWFKVPVSAPAIATSTSITGLRIGTYRGCVTDSCGTQLCKDVSITSPGFCGDEECVAAQGENCVNCEGDCKRPCGMCGDKSCDGTEHCGNCETDCGPAPCGICGDGVCVPEDGESCLNCTDCKKPCGCGDGICLEGQETCQSCSADCGACVCKPGTYQTGPSSCTVCPPGSFNTIWNAQSCIQCTPNTASPGGDEPCAPCPVSHTSGPGAWKCDNCPVGHVRPAGDASCTACPAGTFRCGRAPTCSQCAPGTTSVAGSATCKGCPPGTAQWRTGNETCVSCPANQYSSAYSAYCTACPTGKSAPGGSTHIAACV